jgi:hypothetical protein
MSELLFNLKDQRALLISVYLILLAGTLVKTESLKYKKGDNVNRIQNFF